MSVSLQTAGGAKRVTAITIHDGTTNRQVELGTLANGTANKVFFNALSVTIDPPSVSGSGYRAAAITITTDVATPVVVGGTPPYTYAWTSPDAGWSAASPFGTATPFNKTGVSGGESYSTTFTLTVTDAAGGTATGTVAASVSNNYDPGL